MFAVFSRCCDDLLFILASVAEEGALSLKKKLDDLQGFIMLQLNLVVQRKALEEEEKRTLQAQQEAEAALRVILPIHCYEMTF